MNKVNSESAAKYEVVFTPDATVEEDAIIARAMDILRSRMHAPEAVFTAPNLVSRYLKLKLAELDHEVFGVLFLDNQHGLIKDEIIFRGTINAASVYPREVAKEALLCGAAAVIYYHNHPSGNPTPSRADVRITEKLKDALGLLDIRSLDHMIVAKDCMISFAERGLI